MRVDHAAATRQLQEYKDGVPGFERAEWALSKPDEYGIAELTIENDPHASPQSFANAAGIGEAPTIALAVKNVQAPAITGIPSVGQYVTADLGVWDEPDPDEKNPGIVAVNTFYRWLYDGDEETPVVIPEGDPHGVQTLLVPRESLGKQIVLRVTKGRTTVYSQPFGPIEGAQTEFTFRATPIADSDIVRANESRVPGKAAGKQPVARAKTPTSATKAKALSKPPAKVKAPSAAKEQSLVKVGANEKTPPPAADTVGKE